MAENVISVDFGRDYNESARKLARLLSVVEDHRENVRKDPVKFLELAHDEIVRLRQEMAELHSAMFATTRIKFEDVGKPPACHPLETVVVPREDYDRMKASEAIVRGWHSLGIG